MKLHVSSCESGLSVSTASSLFSSVSSSCLLSPAPQRRHHEHSASLSSSSSSSSSRSASTTANTSFLMTPRPPTLLNTSLCNNQSVRGNTPRVKSVEPSPEQMRLHRTFSGDLPLTPRRSSTISSSLSSHYNPFCRSPSLPTLPEVTDLEISNTTLQQQPDQVLTIQALSNWGHPGLIGMSRLQLMKKSSSTASSSSSTTAEGVEMEPIKFTELTSVTSTPMPPGGMSVVARLFSGLAGRTNGFVIKSSPLQPRQQGSATTRFLPTAIPFELKIELPSEIEVVGIKFVNFCDTPLERGVGVKSCLVFLNNRIMWHGDLNHCTVVPESSFRSVEAETATSFNREELSVTWAPFKKNLLERQSQLVRSMEEAHRTTLVHPLNRKPLTRPSTQILPPLITITQPITI